MRYRVHQFVTVRVPVDIEAESVREAVQKAAEQFSHGDIYQGEYAEETLGYQVDPIFENGEVDYTNGVSLEWKNGYLVDFNGDSI